MYWLAVRRTGESQEGLEGWSTALGRGLSRSEACAGLSCRGPTPAGAFQRSALLSCAANALYGIAAFFMHLSAGTYRTQIRPWQETAQSSWTPGPRFCSDAKKSPASLTSGASLEASVTILKWRAREGSHWGRTAQVFIPHRFCSLLWCWGCLEVCLHWICRGRPWGTSLPSSLWELLLCFAKVIPSLCGSFIPQSIKEGLMWLMQFFFFISFSVYLNYFWACGGPVKYFGSTTYKLYSHMKLIEPCIF